MIIRRYPWLPSFQTVSGACNNYQPFTLAVFRAQNVRYFEVKLLETRQLIRFTACMLIHVRLFQSHFTRTACQTYIPTRSSCFSRGPVPCTRSVRSPAFLALRVRMLYNKIEIVGATSHGALVHVFPHVISVPCKMVDVHTRTVGRVRSK